MAEEFPSNSHRERDQRTVPPPKKQPAETKKVGRITSGEVIRRKKPLGTRLKEVFIGGDARGVWGYVAMDVLVPAAKDMVTDATIQAVERMVYGEARSRGRGGWRPVGTVGHVRYDGYSRPLGGSTPPWRREAEPRREISRRGRASHSFDEIVLESRGEAEQVIDTLFEMISQYNQATVSDLYEMVGISSAYTDNKYGWTDLRGANVQHVRGGGYLLNLPKPEPLD